MGYLLKEALKTLCGVNQWSYAVFWKIGCQNPKLLIWEDCYYETASCSGLSGNLNPENAFHDYNGSWISAETHKSQSGDKVHLLVNKMMMDNQVHLVGEGLVGRVAFTGNHQWIGAENYYREAHPPEVQKELSQQFSAGMQTVAVIPVLPHGVVQFGSFLTIMENMGFVNDATSLLLQLGYLSELPNECTPNAVVNAACSFDSFNYVGNSGESSMLDSQTSFSLATEIQTGPHHYSKIAPPVKLDFSSSNQLTNGVAKAEVIHSNSDMWTNQNASHIPRSNPNLGTISTPNVSAVLMPAQRTNPGMIYYSGDANITSKNPTSSELKNAIFSKTKASNSDSVNRFTTNPMFASQFAQSESNACKREIEQDTLPMFVPGFVEDGEKQKSGDDLFDVLGADFKNKLFSNCWYGRPSDEPAPNAHNWENNNNSESGIFSSTNSDHLLEAVVSKVSPSAKQSLDDDVSCKTTLTNISSSSAPNSSLPYVRFGISDHMKGELFGVPKFIAKAGPSKEESGSYSQGSSIYGSQISSWIGKDQKGKQSNSVSTGYSKKPDEMSKTNRKRLKPGENPRPRPKDRQMIQDRVKELREIVPNGAKCSIDALLERTIKHMLFLQSVTKHADKLKQTGEPKIISKDGGLLLKDNFEGGATWAYEVGSQSMVCPIIVEDLNQPRQMLVEMLCEERGLFLEIADIIRGLGLTILKGVMETRDDKIWARFAVEANRDVTRMEIFISLVRLLEQSAKNVVPQPNGTATENVMAQQFHQVAPIPVRSHSLQ